MIMTLPALKAILDPQNDSRTRVLQRKITANLRFDSTNRACRILIFIIGTGKSVLLWQPSFYLYLLFVCGKQGSGTGRKERNEDTQEQARSKLACRYLRSARYGLYAGFIPIPASLIIIPS
ncbi:MAG: hypothetical protein LBO80_11125, partial [Treponema sp.]|nr:hypothetical protein [Treponema sp.]